MDCHTRARPTHRVRGAPGRRVPADHPLRRRRRLPEPGRPRRPRPDQFQPGGFAMRWVTRARPKTDRIACPWLIRRFIDPDAEILYVPTDQVLNVARRPSGHGSDTTGPESTHRGNQCTFDVLSDAHELGTDPARDR